MAIAFASSYRARTAIAVGSILGTRLPERAIKLSAAAAFVVFGALLVAQGLALIQV